MRTDLLDRKQDILKWIEQHRSKAYMAKQLNCNPKTINPLLERLGIQYDGNQSGKGFSKTNDSYMPLEQYLLESQDIQSNKVRLKLLKEGYKEAKCECCGYSQWMGKPISLQLHHKDGNRNNNTLENFQLLCPNCHAMTDSYRGKNSAK